MSSQIQELRSLQHTADLRSQHHTFKDLLSKSNTSQIDKDDIMYKVNQYIQRQKEATENVDPAQTTQLKMSDWTLQFRQNQNVGNAEDISVVNALLN
jgi:hypothetical protein